MASNYHHSSINDEYEQFRAAAMRTSFIVGAVGLVVVAAMFVLMALCCVRQRRLRRGGRLRTAVHSSKIIYRKLTIYISTSHV